MDVKLADYSGFCFGVREAVNKLESVAGDGVYTFGPIIHNKSVVDRFAKTGVVAVETLDGLPEGSVVVVRAHGVPRSFYECAAKKAFRVVDCTCPYVAKIHRIVERASQAGRKVVIFGNSLHPEVIGISGWADDVSVYAKVDDAEGDEGDVTVVVQTTYDADLWERSQEEIRRRYPRSEIHNTVCSATRRRQDSARELAETSDFMVVVGDPHSSNTKELFRICKTFAEAVMVESAEELAAYSLKDKSKIGVIAGASTPDEVIAQVILKLDKERNSK